MFKSNKSSFICKICGSTNLPSYEHVPPQSALNNKKIKFYTGDAIFKLAQNQKAKFKIAQKGFGGFFLCESCNNNAGSWYVKAYSDFANFTANHILNDPGRFENKMYHFEFERMNTLAFIKQILVIISTSIKTGFSESREIKDFLMNPTKDNIELPFDIELYLVNEKVAPIMTGVTLEKKTMEDGKGYNEIFLEFCFFPIGILLNFKKEYPINFGMNISRMSNMKYKDEPIEMYVPLKKETYSSLGKFPLYTRNNII